MASSLVSYRIRPATICDVPDVCQTVCRSITDLCSEDHQADEATISVWLSNKTESNFGSWITSANHVAVVAEGAKGIVGFGLLDRLGTLALFASPRTIGSQESAKPFLARLEEPTHAGSLWRPAVSPAR